MENVCIFSRVVIAGRGMGEPAGIYVGEKSEIELVNFVCERTRTYLGIEMFIIYTYTFFKIFQR